MNSTTAQNPRSSALAISALALALLAAPAHAAPANSVGLRTADEGTVSKVPVTMTCSLTTTCTYVIETHDGGSADAGADFTPATKTKTLKQGRKLKLKLPVEILEDDECEADETFGVKLTRTTGDDRVLADTTQIIAGEDCEGDDEDEVETDGPSFPADSGTPTETTTQLTNGTMKECRTPFWLGTTGGNGNWGAFNKGCQVKIQCPATARTCQARSETAINLERNNGQKVTMNSRMWAFSQSDTPFWHRDLSCAQTNFCRNEDSVMMRGGEYMVAQCNGVREATEDNRSSVRCSLTVEKVS